jgi:hypothetical protein
LIFILGTRLNRNVNQNTVVPRELVGQHDKWRETGVDEVDSLRRNPEHETIQIDEAQKPLFPQGIDPGVVPILSQIIK